jgi:DNA helicase-2/ATP-dependent DNA helicase PcrA
MTGGLTIADDIDAAADAEIASCLTLSSPRSFFLFAGAGSGKTRSLVTALNHVRAESGAALKLKGQRVAVITFTNAASDEIKSRMAFDPLIDVSTIHHFAWSLISGFNRDIREYLRSALAIDITNLEAEQARGRKASVASANRLSKIASKRKRFANLDYAKKFVYSPTGDNRGRDALSHAEVIAMTAWFLETKPTMQSILVGRYPLLLIDESQDTSKALIDALFAVQVTHKKKFALGLLGDMMQRIYNDGKDGLGQGLPPDWATPGKQMNHRCPRRVVTLINKVRSSTDKQVQKWRSDSIEGVVRLFILPGDTTDKADAERLIAQHMARMTADEKWRDQKYCKSLTLEHRMAARRMNFHEIFVPLYEVDSWRTSLLRGELPAVRFFSAEVLPLVKARQRNDSFAVARIAKALSPLMSSESLRAANDKKDQLRAVSHAIDQLSSLWTDGADPSLLEVLRSVAATQLLVIPESLQTALQEEAADADVDDADVDERKTKRAEAIRKFLAVPFSQVEPFATYIAGKAHFDTHQGVKGLEFDRVMVIMDDGEARGFLFKYENLFGGKGAGDLSVEGTRRLFYVTCSRAKQSLALVAYTDDPARVRRFVLGEDWFRSDEIVMGIPPSD